MSIFEKTTILLQVLSSVSVTTALFFAYVQSRAAADQAKLLRKSLIQEAYITFEASLLDFDKVLIENSDVLQYFYGGRDVGDDDDPSLLNKVNILAIYYLDYFDHVLSTERQIPGATNWSEENWETWIEGMFQSSPSMRRVIRRYSDWYDTRLFEIAQRMEKGADDSYL
jgi:hypothetical protein